jgi:hypothetical protein
MLRGLGRQRAGGSPTSSIHLVRLSDGDAMHGFRLLDVAGAPNGTVLGCSMAYGINYASYQISRLRRCCLYTGPGLVLSLVPLSWAGWCWNGRLTGRSRRRRRWVVPLRHGRGGRSSNMHALVALSAAFRMEYSLDYFQEVLQGLLALVRPG